MRLRVAGQHAEHDGYYNDGYDDEDTSAGRAALYFDSGSGLDATLIVDFAHVGGKGSGGTIIPLLFDEGDERLGPSDPRVIADYLTRQPTPRCRRSSHATTDIRTTTFSA